MKYKAEIRVPTNTYAYINVWCEDTPEAIVTLHNEFQALYRASQRETEAVKETIYPVGKGLMATEWRKTLDAYMETGILEDGADVYSRMNEKQQGVIQELKKYFKRMEARMERQLDEDFGEGTNGNGQS